MWPLTHFLSVFLCLGRTFGMTWLCYLAEWAEIFSPLRTVLPLYYCCAGAFESSRQESPCSALLQQGKSSQAPGPDRLEKGRLQPHPQPHTHGSQSNGKTHREMVCLPRNVQTTDKMGTRVPQVSTTNGASSPEFRTLRSQRNTAQ